MKRIEIYVDSVALEMGARSRPMLLKWLGYFFDKMDMNAGTLIEVMTHLGRKEVATSYGDPLADDRKWVRPSGESLARAALTMTVGVPDGL